MFWRFSHLMSAGTGISMKIMAALSSTLMLACVKGIDGSIPVGEVIFFRSVIALIPYYAGLNCKVVCVRVFRLTMCAAILYVVWLAQSACT
ncbi:membrane protein [Klebsiella pneumoniae]|nr:membrane protein [Klebsiella pneumoniae]